MIDVVQTAVACTKLHCWKLKTFSAYIACSEAAYAKFQNQPYKIVPDPNNMDDIKFIKLGIHTVQAEVNAWCQDFKILCRH